MGPSLLAIFMLRFILNSTLAQWRFGTFSKQHTAMKSLSPVPNAHAWLNALPIERWRAVVWQSTHGRCRILLDETPT